jgi:hypothetical protein
MDASFFISMSTRLLSQRVGFPGPYVGLPELLLCTLMIVGTPDPRYQPRESGQSGHCQQLQGCSSKSLEILLKA